MKKMRTMLVFVAAAVLVFTGCVTIVDRWTTYGYYLWNGRNTDIQIVGICLECSNDNGPDTLIDAVVASGKSLFLLSGLEMVSLSDDAPEFKSIRIEGCDTVYISDNGQPIAQFINPYKSSAIIEDSLSKIFNFDDRDDYVLFNTIEYEGDGPQPKEKQYRFVID